MRTYFDLGSDIIQLSLPGGKNIVVLDTFEMVTDLLSKRSAVYSDRLVFSILYFEPYS